MTNLVDQLKFKELELLAQKATIEDALREIRAGLQVADALTKQAAEASQAEPKE